jgi:hypothetical protein
MLQSWTAIVRVYSAWHWMSECLNVYEREYAYDLCSCVIIYEYCLVWECEFVLK